jgi:serine/threonine protein kinase
MVAHLIKVGETPPGTGGQFEISVIKSLRDTLSPCFTLIANVSFDRGQGYYECDCLVVAPGVCDLLEMKAVHSAATVYEDSIVALDGYSWGSVFSTADSKAKRIRGRLGKVPFRFQGDEFPWVRARIVLPDRADVRFAYQEHRNSGVVLKVSEVVDHYKSEDRRIQAAKENIQIAKTLRSRWEAFCAPGAQRGSVRRIGRFAIQRELASDGDVGKYHAIDEPPCKMEVLLREFPYDPLLAGGSLDQFLGSATRDMQILRRIRHQGVLCVTGHFQTGASIVEVSDWFSDTTVEDVWDKISALVLFQKLHLMVRISEAVSYCHEQGIFHRNLSADSLLVDPGLEELKLSGFAFARAPTVESLTRADLENRDVRLITPEEIDGSANNSRLSDVFQCGVLFYRLLEDGNWPFESTFDYCTSSGEINWAGDGSEGWLHVRRVVESMLSVSAADRPALMSAVQRQLTSIRESIE